MSVPRTASMVSAHRAMSWSVRDPCCCFRCVILCRPSCMFCSLCRRYVELVAYQRRQRNVKPKSIRLQRQDSGAAEPAAVGELTYRKTAAFETAAFEAPEFLITGASGHSDGSSPQARQATESETSLLTSSSSRPTAVVNASSASVAPPITIMNGRIGSIKASGMRCMTAPKAPSGASTPRT